MGYVFFLFGRKERTKEKSILSVARKTILVQTFWEGYIREVTQLSCGACLAQSQRRLLLSRFMAHASYNLTSFRDSANGRFLV